MKQFIQLVEEPDRVTGSGSGAIVLASGGCCRSALPRLMVLTLKIIAMSKAIAKDNSGATYYAGEVLNGYQPLLSSTIR